jgi:uncharacterized protein YodC (DUF2158 family)
MDGVKKGDRVMLKSGSPVMTVEDASDTNNILCVWWDGKRKQMETFSLETLTTPPVPSAPQVVHTDFRNFRR